MKISNKLVAAGLSGLLAVGIAGAALADDPAAPGSGQAPSAEEAARRPHHGARARIAKGLLKNAAETIGIEVRALAEELKSGKTIAQVATANNVDPQLVIDNAVAAANARIDAAVEAGKIPEARAVELKAKLAEKITKFVNEGRPQRPAGERPAAPAE
jgi:urease gamma subunit